ncbi:MAG: delta-60 repeat domain-containing protein [Flavobacteriales bacterium]|nr:delta-60 repeat domain-containing protein [Flavobacteriales bacterium]
MRNALLLSCCLLASLMHAQVPIIDYDFLAVPPSVQVNKVVPLPDGRILVGGFFMNYAGSGKNHLVRLNNDGTVDASWNTSGAGPSNQVMDIAVMSDGRIVIAGNFVTYNGVNSYFITRLLPNGDRDPTFNIPPNAINGAVLAIDVQSHNKVVAVGEFFVCYGHSMPYIARFLVDGAVDLAFDIGSGFNAVTRDVLVLPDDRILVGGDFGSYNGNSSWGLALLTAEGPYDTGMVMDPGFTGGFGTVRKVMRQPNGKIIVGGSFAFHNGQPSHALARIHLDGSRDPAFTSPFYPFAGILALAVDDAGHVFAGGEFTDGMYDPNVPGPGRFIRLQPNGTRDDVAYDVGEGPGPGQEPTSFVRDIAIQTDGKVLLGGFFGSFHNPAETQYRNLIRLHPEAATGIDESGAALNLHVLVDTNTGELLVTDPFGTPGSTLRLHDAVGRLLLERSLPPTDGAPVRVGHGLPAGTYVVGITNGGRLAHARVVTGTW